MIRSGYLVLDSMFLQKILKNLVDEMFPSVTDYNSRDSKSREYNGLKQLQHNSSIIGGTSYRFHPL